MKIIIPVTTFIAILYYGLYLGGVISHLPIVEFSIWIVYVFYFFARLKKQGSNKFNYVLSQYLDIIALLPVFAMNTNASSDFARYLVLIVIVFDYLIDYLDYSLFNRPLIAVSLAYLIAMVSGTIGFIRFESMSFGEGLWLSFISSTTVGYGDISAVTLPGKLVTVYVVIAGTIIFGAILVSVVMMILDDRRKQIIEDAETNENDYENIQYIDALFSQFRVGEITLKKLENEVKKEIDKKDKE